MGDRVDSGKFTQLAREIERRRGVAPSPRFVPDRCPDDAIPRSVIEFDGEDGDESTSVVLVLESPHVEEFRGAHSPRAANGRTGDSIESLFKEVLETSGIAIRGKARVRVVNAIPFQCSLGHRPQLVRDAVFKACWQLSDVVDDLQMRLSSIVEDCGPRTIVINACTAGPHGVRRVSVEFAIREVQSRFRFLYDRLEHPANWGRRRNQKRKLPPDPRDRYRWKKEQV
jgi:hypothetical protein